MLILVTAFFGMNLFANYTIPPDYNTVEWPGSVELNMRLETDLLETKVPILKNFKTADSYAYINMAEEGYDDFRIDDPHPPANWVFFPMFPLVMRGISEITSLQPVISGLIASNIFLLIAMFFLYGIGRERGLKDHESRIVACLPLIAPAGVFFSVPYTESLFLMLAAGAVYFSLRRQWLPAFLMAAFSTVTRNVGVVIFAFTCCSLLLEYRLWRFHWRDWRLLVYFLIGCIPLTSYLLYMLWLTGDFFAPIDEQVNWGRFTTLPFVSYAHYLKGPYFQTSSGWENGLISFIVATAVFLVFIGYLVYMIVNWKRLVRPGHQVLLFAAGALLIVIPFSSGEHLASIPRYMTVVLPFYFYLVELFRRRLTAVAGYALFSFMFFIVFTIAYFNEYLFVF